ncbi:acyl-CoA thioesterase [Siphonobacter curvatus]|uniref:Acyl-CoA thioesterase n=1 Tax=Siphonobacter curvatus TaxID=2094562 RepID=A0A2S7ILY8_9BACT|nr:acyl-CoA thioesterase [Siphonobacter curvatus]PQA58570.1 acyl-CoA thioesterase [Siphonobacter curvatus]
MTQPKFASESLTTMTEMVFPNDTNNLGNLMGGNLLRLMDICGAIAAQKHSRHVVVTASVDNVAFKDPIPLGSVITLRAFVTRAFNSSMEVFIDVHAENIPAGERFMTNRAFYTFVAVGADGKPSTDIPEVVPQTDEEKSLYDAALRRRQLRLVLAGRMMPAEATELAKLFELQA